MMIVYFVHDLGDPAVGRRVRTLQSAGAVLALAGFRRKDALAQNYDVSTLVELGRTFDGRLGQRAAKALSIVFRRGSLARKLPAPEVILARNLEMLFIAKMMQRAYWPAARLSYEVLDVHRMMLRRDPIGAALRWIERALLKGVQSIILSSPAFRDEYFIKVQNLPANYYIVENKVFGDGKDMRAPAPSEPPAAGPPWRIAWYGMLRCQKSLDILDRTSRALGGLLRVDIRGRPTLRYFRDFEGQIAANPYLEYGGPYAAAAIWKHYETAHFVWGVDYFEEGVNSAWLLPNRLYEGGAANVPVIALADVETGRWLERLGVGVLLNNADVDLAPFIEALDQPRWRGLRDATRGIARSALFWSDEESKALVKALHG
jgi:hypothetical protein